MAKKLTITDLEKLEPGVFKSGLATINHPYYGQSVEYPKEIEVKWVAVRGDIPDWAIYHSYDSNIVIL